MRPTSTQLALTPMVPHSGPSADAEPTRARGSSGRATRAAPAPGVLKVSLGGLACSVASVPPQQARVASLFTAQVWSRPALTAVKVPLGGLACPVPLSPQQARVPSICTPQVWDRPALM